MSNQWIKMRVTLRDDPRVVALALRLGQPRATVLGGLFLMWCIADAHGDFMPGVTPASLSDLVGIKGFAEVLPSDWIQIRPDGLRFPDYGRHNGATAKRRALEAARKAGARNPSASDADKKRPREEKIREETTKASAQKPRAPVADPVRNAMAELEKPDFASWFWDQYPNVPNKHHRAEAERVWWGLPEADQVLIKARVKVYAVAVAKWSQPDRKFVLRPDKWLLDGVWKQDPKNWIRTEGKVQQEYMGQDDRYEDARTP